MPKLSEVSMARLGTCDPRLQELFLSVIREVDFSVLCGHRGQEAQDEAFATGKSLVKWPHGKHNSLPSQAVDVMPDPIRWDDHEGTKAFSEVVKRHAQALCIEVTWGGDWKGFVDEPHWEVA
jgi:hypothetical protein